MTLCSAWALRAWCFSCRQPSQLPGAITKANPASVRIVAAFSRGLARWACIHVFWVSQELLKKLWAYKPELPEHVLQQAVGVQGNRERLERALLKMMKGGCEAGRCAICWWGRRNCSMPGPPETAVHMVKGQALHGHIDSRTTAAWHKFGTTQSDANSVPKLACQPHLLPPLSHNIHTTPVFLQASFRIHSTAAIAAIPPSPPIPPSHPLLLLSCSLPLSTAPLPLSSPGEKVKVVLLGGSVSIRGWNSPDETFMKQVRGDAHGRTCNVN